VITVPIYISYTNKEVLKNLPQRVTLVGRIRKDPKLYALPEVQPGSGRKRVYGQRLPTPEAVRQSEQYQWQQVEAWAAGKIHKFDVKIISDARWRSAGPQNLTLICYSPIRVQIIQRFQNALPGVGLSFLH
jgi:hypothetical protein